MIVVRERERFQVVADGVYLLERAKVNCYLVVADDGIVLVDAGLPRSWPLLIAALDSFGATPGDINAVVLTHGHFDHVGMCERLIWENHTPTHIQEQDAFLARHPYRYSHEVARSVYPFRYPASIPVLARMVAAGAMSVRGIETQPDIIPGVAVDAPIDLVPVASPGHTDGHCGYLLPSRGILFSGDALVTFDPYTGHSGPRIVAGAATADSTTALSALDAYVETEAQLVLPGHGDPFHGPIRTAVQKARAAGPA